MAGLFKGFERIEEAREHLGGELHGRDVCGKTQF